MTQSWVRLLVTIMVLSFCFNFPENVRAASTQARVSIPGNPEGLEPPSIEPIQPPPESLQDDIPDWKARWELARLLSYAKRYEESLIEYKALAVEKPDLWQAKIEMARVMFWSGLKPDAVAVLEGIPPQYVDASGQLLMAELYVALKSFDKAEAIYRAHLKARPQDYEVVVKLADLLSWSKRYDEAIAQYKTVLQATPDDVQLRRKYAYVLIWAGRNAEAAAELKKTLK